MDQYLLLSNLKSNIYYSFNNKLVTIIQVKYIFRRAHFTNKFHVLIKKLILKTEGITFPPFKLHEYAYSLPVYSDLETRYELFFSVIHSQRLYLCTYCELSKDEFNVQCFDDS